MAQSTRDITHEQIEGEIRVKGVVDSDLGETGYEVLVYNKENQLMFQDIRKFNENAGFEFKIDITDPKWKKENSILLKLVYGIP